MPSIKVVHDFEDKSIKNTITPVLERTYREARELIPALPEKINIYFDNWCLIPDLGVGAAAVHPLTITISFDKSFGGDDKAQTSNLISVFMHELYHVAHGWTLSGSKIVQEGEIPSALQRTFYEGCDVVFERDYSSSNSGYLDYSNLNARAILEEIKRLGNDFDLDEWAFMGAGKREKWTLYKVGTWMIDEYLKKNKDKTVLDLLKLKPEDVVKDIE